MHRVNHLRRIMRLHSNRESILFEYEKYYPQGTSEYMMAVCTCEFIDHHYPDSNTRRNGQLTREHFYGTAALLIWEYKVFEKDYGIPSWIIVLAAILHDVLEDLTDLNMYIFAKYFSREIARIVYVVSKDPLEKFEGCVDPEKARIMEYHIKLFQLSKIWHVVIKVCDRLYNMLTMEDEDVEKIKKKLKENEDVVILLMKKFYLDTKTFERVIYSVRQSLPKESNA